MGAQAPPPTEVSDGIEGMLIRKHEWENTTKKASNRYSFLLNFLVRVLLDTARYPESEKLDNNAH